MIFDEKEVVERGKEISLLLFSFFLHGTFWSSLLSLGLLIRIPDNPSSGTASLDKDDCRRMVLFSLFFCDGLFRFVK